MLLVVSCLLAVMLLVSLFNLLTAPRLEDAPAPTRLPPVSLLIPARNEADNLRRNLPGWLASDYPALEILVLDDQSEDETATVVGDLGGAGRVPVKLVAGTPLPAGWLGKPWACHQLAEHATGELLIFCDADVSTTPEAVTQTVSTLTATHADALTALPRQHFSGVFDRAVVPLVAQLPVATLLPLSLVPRTAAPSLSMGNGQWFAFSRKAYDGLGGHRAVRDQVVEDVALARRVKSAGFRLVPVLATRSLSVRMYGSWRAVRAGFRKNLFHLVGATSARMTIALVAFSLTAIYPWMSSASGQTAWLPLLLLALLRVVAAATFRHDLATVVLHPIGAIVLPLLGLESWMASRRGTLTWKGRLISPVRKDVIATQ